MDLTPAGVLATWAAGLAAGLAFVAHRRIVGRGYVWLAAGVTAAFGLTAFGAGAGGWVLAGSGAVALAAAAPRVHSLVAALAAGGGLLLGGGAVLAGSHWMTAATGALFLGGVTTEMMLGHWYLVDPSLPRPALRLLAIAGAAGAVLDTGAASVLGGLPWAAGDAVLGVGFLVLAATSLVLMILVWSALGERGYSGVMAATGLSYLAVLTAIGAVVLGRMLI